jgi:hypothetical protein
MLFVFSHTLSMHQNQTHVRHPYLFSSKAPPISAPDVPMFTLAIPQSEPVTDKNNSASRKLVMIAEDNPALRFDCDGIFYRS